MMFLQLTCALAGHAQEQPPPSMPEIVTDRPDITESSIAILKRSVQFENGLTWTNDRGKQTLGFSETLVRLGVSHRTEFAIVAPNRLHDLRGSGFASGFGDAAIGVKHQIGPPPGNIGLAVIAARSLPTEDGERNRTWEPTFWNGRSPNPGTHSSNTPAISLSAAGRSNWPTSGRRTG